MDPNKLELEAEAIRKTIADRGSLFDDAKALESLLETLEKKNHAVSKSHQAAIGEVASKGQLWSRGVMKLKDRAVRNQSSGNLTLIPSAALDKFKKISEKKNKKHNARIAALDDKLSKIQRSLKEQSSLSNEDRKQAEQERDQLLEEKYDLNDKHERELAILSYNMNKGLPLEYGLDQGGILTDTFAQCLPVPQAAGAGIEDGDDETGDAEGDQDNKEKDKKEKKKKKRDPTGEPPEPPSEEELAKEFFETEEKIVAARLQKRAKELQAKKEEAGNKKADNAKAIARKEKEIYNLDLEEQQLKMELASYKGELKAKFFEHAKDYRKARDTNAENRRHWKEHKKLDDEKRELEEEMSSMYDEKEHKAATKKMELIKIAMEREREINETVLDNIENNHANGVGIEDDAVDALASCVPPAVLAANQKMFDEMQPMINKAKKAKEVTGDAMQYTAMAVRNEFTQSPFVSGVQQLRYKQFFGSKESGFRDGLKSILKVGELDYNGIELEEVMTKMKMLSEKDGFRSAINERDENGITPLEHAVRALEEPGNAEKLGTKIVSLFLELGAVPTVLNWKKQTPLIVCTQLLGGFPDISVRVASALVGNDPNLIHIEHVDSYGHTALSYAAQALNAELCDFLLDSGASMTTPIGPNLPGEYTNVFLDLLRMSTENKTSFDISAKRKGAKKQGGHSSDLQIKVIKRVFLTRIEKIVQTNKVFYDNLVDSQGRTPIMHALLGGSPTVIFAYSDHIHKLSSSFEYHLLKKRDYAGMNALMYAVRLGNTITIEHEKREKTPFRYLLDRIRKESVSLQRIKGVTDVNGCGVLFHACCVRSSNECVFNEVWYALAPWRSMDQEKARVAVLAGRLGIKTLDQLGLHPLAPVWAKPTMKPPLLLRGLVDTSNQRAIESILNKANPVTADQFAPLAVALAQNGLEDASKHVLDNMAPKEGFLPISSTKASVEINMNNPSKYFQLPDKPEVMLRELLNCGEEIVLKHIFTRAISEELWAKYYFKSVLLDFVIYMVFLCLQSATVLFKNDAAIGYGSTAFALSMMYTLQIPVIVIFVWLIMQEVLELRSLGLSGYFNSLANYFDIFTYILIFVELVTMMAGLSNWQTWASIALLCSWMRLLNYLTKFRVTGVFVMIIFNMILRTRSFIIVLVFFFAAFGFSFYVLLVGQDGYTDAFEVFMTLFRAFVGDFDYDVINQYGGLVGKFLFISFCFLVSTLLLNLLIAVMMSAYDEAYGLANIVQVDLRCKAIAREFTVSGDKVVSTRIKELVGAQWSGVLPAEINDFSVEDEEGDEEEDENPEEQYLDKIADNVNEISKKEKRIVQGFKNRLEDDATGHKLIADIMDKNAKDADLLAQRIKAVQKLLITLQDKKNKMDL